MSWNAKKLSRRTSESIVDLLNNINVCEGKIWELECYRQLLMLQEEDAPRAKRKNSKCQFLLLVLAVTALAFASAAYVPLLPGFRLVKILAGGLLIGGSESRDARCLLPLLDSLLDFVRPPMPCDVCRGMAAVDRVSNISAEEFASLYAYTGRPVIVTDATLDWSAIEHFSLDFFRRLYLENEELLDGVEANCQFFPYKSGFRSLSDALNKASRDLNSDSGTWYFGWSNCDPVIASILRSYYQRPYFLPIDSDSSNIDWIFIGNQGYGAHMHVDNVGYPSWQAQVSGTKEWILKPGPECYLSCPSELRIVLEKGDTLVLDTNMWYHSTKVLSTELSIAIGSEFD